MKIIGLAGNDGYRDKFLLEATRDEIAHLLGFYHHELREQKPPIEIKVGLALDVSVEFNKLLWLRRRNSEFDGLVAQLRATADRIADSKPAFDAIIQDGPIPPAPR